jgi:hypothetical protein
MTSVREICLNADAFRRAYPSWPSAEPEEEPMAKSPTPQGISALLRKAGFARSEWERQFKLGTCVQDGYRVVKAMIAGQPAVSVRWCRTAGSGDDAGRRSVLLSDYARAIEAAGWRAQRTEREVIVTAKAGD